MQNSTSEFLIDYMHSHLIGAGKDYTIESLFKMYLAIEIKSLEDLSNAPNDFCDFLLRNLDSIKTNNLTLKAKLPKIIESDRNFFSKLIRQAQTKYIETFVSIVSEISPSKSTSHILDVGSGDIAYSSILLAREFEKCTSLDPYFFLPPETLASLGVTPLTEYFTRDTEVSDYDFVVGKKPCSAIEHMVKQCSDANKPYFIKLCGCNAPKSHYSQQDSYLAWHDSLPDIDQYVKFYLDYAFNIDASEEQIKRIIDKYEESLAQQQNIYAKPPKKLSYSTPDGTIQTFYTGIIDLQSSAQTPAPISKSNTPDKTEMPEDLKQTELDYMSFN